MYSFTDLVLDTRFLRMIKYCVPVHCFEGLCLAWHIREEFGVSSP